MLDVSFLSVFADTDATSVDGRRNRRRRSSDAIRTVLATACVRTRAAITAGAYVDVYGAGRHVTAPRCADAAFVYMRTQC